MAPKTSNHHGVIIIGAGSNGIIAAKTYLQVVPNKDILIIDSESLIGGVWSASRIYPGLLYEVPAPLPAMSDFDMCEEMGLNMWEDVSGDVLNKYLVRYAMKHGILSRCRLNTRALSVERFGTGWEVLVQPTGDKNAEPEALTCDKLLLCTGITSNPIVPDFDLSTYEGIHFHSVEMGKRHKELVADNIKTVTIIGGHKSALEAVGTCAQAGKKVNWIIRADGAGPTWMMPAKDDKGESMAKMAVYHAMQFCTTNPLNPNRWLDRFLHSGRWWLGTKLMAAFWRKLTSVILSDRYTKSENGKKLKPHPDSMFWFAPGGTVVHDRDNETLRLVDEEKLIQVHRSGFTSAKGHSITLTTGETIPSDALVLCTGWEVGAPPLFAPPLAAELGLPVLKSLLPAKIQNTFEPLDIAAEKYLQDTYPLLKNQPSIHIPNRKTSRYRLFRALVPSIPTAQNSRTIAFLGNYANGRPQFTAEINSLWCIAYLENLFPEKTNKILLDEEEMNKDISLISMYTKLRYVDSYPYRLSIFESVAFDDQILGDLGIRCDRKRLQMERVKGRKLGWWEEWKAWKEEWFGGYFSGDYEGFVEEFLEGVRARDGSE